MVVGSPSLWTEWRSCSSVEVAFLLDIGRHVELVWSLEKVVMWWAKVLGWLWGGAMGLWVGVSLAGYWAFQGGERVLPGS